MRAVYFISILFGLYTFCAPAHTWRIGPICTDDKLRTELKAQREAIKITSAQVKLSPTQNEPGSKFELTYTLKFPAQNHYLTWPSHLGYWSGHYLKTYPREYIFAAGKDYEYIVEFDSADEPWGDVVAGPSERRIYRTRQDLNKGKAFRQEFVQINVSAGDEWCYGSRTISIPIKDLLAGQ